MSPSTVKRLARHKVSSPEEKLLLDAHRSGRPIVFSDVNSVKAAVASLRKEGAVVTLKKVQEALAAAGAPVPRSSEGVQALMLRAGFRFGVPVKRNANADSAGVVKYRRFFTDRMLQILDEEESEVWFLVLDESMASTSNVVAHQWFDPTEAISSVPENPRSERWLIIAMGVYVKDKHGAISGRLLRETVRVYRPSAKKDDAAIFGTGAIADPTIYRGNLDGDTFESWLDHAFATTSRMIGKKKVKVFVLMDNAKIHGRSSDRPPSQTEKQAVLWQWVREHHTAAAARLLRAATDKAKGPTKKELKAFTDTLVFKSNARKLAEKYGFVVLHTPPYTPELQPIECIWANVKNHLRLNPVRRGAAVRERIVEGFNKLSPSTWLGAWKRSVHFLKLFHSADGKGDQVADAGDLGDDPNEAE